MNLNNDRLEMQTNNESLKLEGKKGKEINSKNLLTGKKGNLANIKMLGEKSHNPGFREIYDIKIVKKKKI